MGRVLRLLLHPLNVCGRNVILPAGIPPDAHITEERMKALAAEQIIADIDGIARFVNGYLHRGRLAVSAYDFLDGAPCLVAVRVLSEGFSLLRKRERFVYLPDETAELYGVYGTHQIADLAVFQHVNVPLAIIGASTPVLRNLGNVSGEVGSEEKVIVQKQHIGLNIEEPECYISMTEGTENEGHVAMKYSINGTTCKPIHVKSTPLTNPLMGYTIWLLCSTTLREVKRCHL